MLFGPSFEEKVKKRNETVMIFSFAAPRKSKRAVVLERDLLPIQARARGSISWKMVNSPTRLPSQREKLILIRGSVQITANWIIFSESRTEQNSLHRRGETYHVM